LDATDTNTLGRLHIYVTKTGALPVFHDYQVISAHVFDTLFSTDTFNVNVVEWNSTAAVANPIANVAAPANLGSLSIDSSGDVQSLPVLITTGTGAGQLKVTGGYVHISSGTGTGQVKLVSGVVGANVEQISSSATAADRLELLMVQTDISGKYTSGAYTTGAREWLHSQPMLISSGTGAGQINFSTGGLPGVNVVQLGTIAQTGRDIGANVLVSTGTGAGQVKITSGIVHSNAVQWNSTAVAANSIANLTSFASGNFSTGAREFLTKAPGANSAVALDLMVERIYQLMFNKMTITDADGSIALRNAADSADACTGSVTDNATITVRSSMTWL
jgi:hypothetical protein